MRKRSILAVSKVLIVYVLLTFLLVNLPFVISQGSNFSSSNFREQSVIRKILNFSSFELISDEPAIESHLSNSKITFTPIGNPNKNLEIYQLNLTNYDGITESCRDIEFEIKIYFDKPCKTDSYFVIELFTPNKENFREKICTIGIKNDALFATVEERGDNRTVMTFELEDNTWGETMIFNIGKNGRSLELSYQYNYDESNLKKFRNAIYYVPINSIRLGYTSNDPDFSVEVNSINAELEFINSDWEKLKIRDIVLFITIPIAIIFFSIALFYGISYLQRRIKKRAEEMEQDIHVWEERMEQAMIDKLSVFVYKGKVEAGETCGICKLPLQKEQLLFQCPECKNLFHRKHFLDWFEKKDYCPICRKKIVD